MKVNITYATSLMNATVLKLGWIWNSPRNNPIDDFGDNKNEDPARREFLLLRTIVVILPHT